MRNELVVLYGAMSRLTEPICATQCRAPRSCCDPMYCEMAMGLAAEGGVELKPTGHERLPLMGPTGCVAPPELRPLCTLHLCSVSSIGFVQRRDGSPDWAANEQYFKLRAEIDRLEFEESEKG